MSDRPACPRVLGRDVRGRVRAALGEELFGVVVTPLLPLRWPDPGGGVAVWAYPAEPLPTGIIKYRITAPSHRITLVVFDAAPRVEELRTASTLGTEEQRGDPPAATELESAEQALLDILVGCGSKRDLGGALGPYVRWLEAHPVVAQDLEGRVPTFFEWLRRAHRNRMPGRSPAR